VAKYNEEVTLPEDTGRAMEKHRLGLEMYADIKEAFEKAIEVVGMEAFKSTSMFIRNERINDAASQKKAA
jgi:hypothetical protein